MRVSLPESPSMHRWCGAPRLRGRAVHPLCAAHVPEPSSGPGDCGSPRCPPSGRSRARTGFGAGGETILDSIAHPLLVIQRAEREDHFGMERHGVSPLGVVSRPRRFAAEVQPASAAGGPPGNPLTFDSPLTGKWHAHRRVDSVLGCVRDPMVRPDSDGSCSGGAGYGEPRPSPSKWVDDETAKDYAAGSRKETLGWNWR
jgi:hypothetical protein